MEKLPVQVWLVEDNEADVRLMKEALDEQALRYELQVFRNGEEALRMVDAAGRANEPPCPDLLMLDLHLPKVDGPEVLRRFRANDNCTHTPVVVLSSLIAPKERTVIEAYPRVLVQEKPFDLDGYLAIGRRIKAILVLSANAQ
jgi:CheY-like chemotaxis protein